MQKASCPCVVYFPLLIGLHLWMVELDDGPRDGSRWGNMTISVTSPNHPWFFFGRLIEVGVCSLGFEPSQAKGGFEF